jgi:hypothetical protein
MDAATLKQAWLEALRSGEYRQTRGTLARDKDGNVASFPEEAVEHCCLGVLSDIVCKLDPNEIWLDYAHVDGVIDQGQQKTLVDMNDGEYDDDTGKFVHYSFAQIADWIEQNVEAT